MKTIKIIVLSLALSASPTYATDTSEAITAGAATTGGAVVGYVTMSVAGISAIGAVGEGACVGSAAGPVGTAVGALIGLAGYGLYRVFN